MKEHVLLESLLYLALIIPFSHICAKLGAYIGQPKAVGEIVGGLLLGGAFSQLYPEFLTQTDTMTPLVISTLAQLGIVLMMFQLGMEFDFSCLKQGNNQRKVGLICLMGIVIPFAAGYGSGVLSANDVGMQQTPSYPFFIGTVFSITALPILGRILWERNMCSSALGTIAITCAALNDLVGWVILGAVVVFGQVVSSYDQFYWRLFLTVGFLLTVFLMVRPLLAKFVKSQSSQGQVSNGLLAACFACVFLLSACTSKLGIFAVLGGFLAGAILFDCKVLAKAWEERISPMVMLALVPLFFVYTGLRTNIGSLSSAEDLVLCVCMVAAACVSKFGASYLACRWSGMSKSDSMALGIMLNTRALMALVVLNIGLDVGAIPQKVFTILVLMAIFSTVITGPVLTFLERKKEKKEALPDAAVVV